MTSTIRHRFIHRSNTELVLPQTIQDQEKDNNDSSTTSPTARLPIVPTRKRIFGLPKRALSWLYSASLGILLLLFIAFNAVIPIDAIVQSKKNLALNTLVVLICCIIFIVLSLILYSIRVFVLRLNLQDIPKYYIPDHYNDLPLSLYNYIQLNLMKCQDILFQLRPNQVVKHPGLYHHSSNEDPEVVDAFPDFLVYEDVLRVFGDVIKYQGFLFKDEHFLPPKSLTYSELLSHFTERGYLYVRQEYADQFIVLYERLRFSGAPIEEADFFKVMELFVKMLNYIDIDGSADGTVANGGNAMHKRSLLDVSDLTDKTKQLIDDIHKRKSSVSTMLSRMTTNDSVVIRAGSSANLVLPQTMAAGSSALLNFDSVQNLSSASSVRRRKSVAKRTHSPVSIDFPKFHHSNPSQQAVTPSSPSTRRPSFALAADPGQDFEDDFYALQRLRRYHSGRGAGSLHLYSLQSSSSLSLSDNSVNTTRHYSNTAYNRGI